MNIFDLIKKSDKITFRDFMEHTLYCPEDGYYGSGKAKIGNHPEADFTTHPILTSPYFGIGLARHLGEIWKMMGKPKIFYIVEMGGGEGSLAYDLLSAIEKNNNELFGSIRLIIIDISPAMIRLQKETLKKFQDKIEWFQGSALDFNRKIDGVFLSNELFDALPSHRVIKKDGNLQEIYVTQEGDNVIEILDQPSTPQIESYFFRLGIDLFEGQQAVVNLDALRLIRKINQNLSKGYIITIDYGYPAETLFGEDKSHIRTGRKKYIGSYPYDRIGEKDITSDVDFSSLILHGRDLGLKDIYFDSELEYFKKWLKGEQIEPEIWDNFVGNNYKVLVQSKGN